MLIWLDVSLLGETVWAKLAMQLSACMQRGAFLWFRLWFEKRGSVLGYDPYCWVVCVSSGQQSFNLDYELNFDICWCWLPFHIHNCTASEMANCVWTFLDGISRHWLTLNSGYFTVVLLEKKSRKEMHCLVCNWLVPNSSKFEKEPRFCEELVSAKFMKETW